MNKTRKWAWLLLGVGGLLLAFVTTQVFQSGDESKAPTALTEEHVQDEEAADYAEAEGDPELPPPQLGHSPIRPPAARTMPPIEIRRDFKPQVHNRADNLPNPAEPPRLKMEEPRTMDKIPGRKQAFNDFEPSPAPDSGESQGYWEPPVDGPSGENGAVPAEPEFDRDPSQSYSPDSDIQPTPSDDLGDGSGD